MDEFITYSVEEKIELTLAYLEKFRKKDSHIFLIDYRGEQFSVEITDELVRQYVIQAVRVAEECLRLETTGELTASDIANFVADMSEKYENSETRDVWSVIKGFSSGGIYDNHIFNDVIIKIGELNGCVIGSAAWRICQRPVLCSAIESVVEASIGHITEDNMCFSVIWYFLRSCFYIREGRND